MKKSITVTAWNRPVLLKAMLESLITNNLHGWTIYLSIEPSSGASEIVNICRSILANQRHEIMVNDVVLGIHTNPHKVITHAFAAGSTLNLHLEEDLLLSPDTTALASWYGQNHRAGWLCLNLLAGPCGSTTFLSDPRFPEQLFLARTFNSLGFVVRREEWENLIEPVWYGGAVPALEGGPLANWRTQGGGGWDWAIYGLLGSRRDVFSVQPVLARATHTGETGTNVNPQFQQAAFQGLEICQKPVDDFQLVETRKLARQVRSLAHAHDEMTELRLQLEKRARVTGAAMARLAGQRRVKDRARPNATSAHRDGNAAGPNSIRELVTRPSIANVVMSVRNGAAHLDAAIRSILKRPSRR